MPKPSFTRPVPATFGHCLIAATALLLMGLGRNATAQTSVSQEASAPLAPAPTVAETWYDRVWPYDTIGNLAAQANGALPAVSGNVAVGPPRHEDENLNDGAYGNGSSWIVVEADPGSNLGWLKIDLGAVRQIREVAFGRDRVRVAPGVSPFPADRILYAATIQVALTDDVYAALDSSNDASEYTTVFDGSVFSGSAYTGTISVKFPIVAARFVKIIIPSPPGTAIDEVEVFSCAGRTAPSTFNIDVACPPAYHSLGGPVLSYTGSPTVASTVTLTGSNLSGNAISGLLLGDCSVPIPLSVVGSVIPGSALCVSPWLTIPSNGGSTSNFVWDVPNDPGFAGLFISAQWIDYEGVLGSIGTSQAIGMNIGL
ncbi:MAG: discoidin domain-containing protein [Planctomycetes bacterium]|nr:discoidin domain-containing protein [Planctomycetota bacterium]